MSSPAHDQTVKEVTATVGDDPVKAQAALNAEHATGDPRSTLVEHLQSVIDKAAGDRDQETADAPATGTVRVKANASVLGLTVGETGDVPDDAETQACIERGLVEKSG